MVELFGVVGLTPAAFGRLCVETISSSVKSAPHPSAAFGRLCVETRTKSPKRLRLVQPPSGGCVLKPKFKVFGFPEFPAAFGRLCVETRTSSRATSSQKPAAFGRLCVETRPRSLHRPPLRQPPSGGCVLKLGLSYTMLKNYGNSRLRAAVC